jgi:inward rectifier potassium channel
MARKVDLGADTERVGLPRHVWDDLYHRVLSASWPRVLATIVGAYLGANVVFALLYLAAGDAIDEARPGSFGDAFFFSVQTMATIGYGKMGPRGMVGNVLVTVEALVGLIGTTMSTGLVFAKFARPRAHVMWSDVAVVCPRDGKMTLQFRVANERSSRIVEATMRVSMLKDEVTKEGESLRRFYDVPLVRERSAMFALSWTAVHVIDETSPLHGATAETLKQWDAALVVTLVGLEEQLAATVHARHFYTHDHIKFGHRLVDIMSRTPEGRRRVDYTRFHDIEKVAEKPVEKRPAESRAPEA